jgi:uncharacterized protein (DUF433 family)
VRLFEESLFDNILYADDLAERWNPNSRTPRVVVDPKIAFGHPVVADAGVPTRCLFEAYLAEGSIDVVADLYKIDLEGVRQAVEFERRLVA